MISTFPTLLLRRCLTPLRVCETNQCVCERSKPALLKSVWKCELLEFDCLCRLAMRGLHYGQELVSTNRPDTFAQTKPPTTTILLAISRRTIQFPWPAFRDADRNRSRGDHRFPELWSQVRIVGRRDRFRIADHPVTGQFIDGCRSAVQLTRPTG